MRWRIEKRHSVFIAALFAIILFLYTALTVYETRRSIVFNEPRFYKETTGIRRPEWTINFPRQISALTFDSSGEHFYTLMPYYAKVAIFSAEDNERLGERTLRVGKGGVMEDICFSSGLNTLVVSDSNYDRLLVFSSGLGGPVEEIRVGDYPTRLEITRDGERLFVLNYWEGTIMEVDLIKREVAKTIKVGNYPKDFALSKGGDFAYITLEKDDTVNIVDLKKGVVAGIIPVGSEPWGIFVDPTNDRIGYVANSHENTVSQVDFLECREVQRFYVEGYPTDIMVSPDGNFLFLAHGMGGYVSVIDALNGEIVEEIRTGLFPASLYLNEHNGLVYVVSTNDYYLSIFDPAVGWKVAKED